MLVMHFLPFNLALPCSGGQSARRAISSGGSTGPRPLARVRQLERRRAESADGGGAAADPGLVESLSMAYGSIANSVATTVENIVLVPIR
jgi:hypothetical protein